MDDAIKQIAEEMGLTDASVGQRTAFLGITTEDVESLRSVPALLGGQEQLQRVVEVYLEHLDRNGFLSEFLGPTEALATLQGKLLDHLQTLLQCNYNRVFAESRIRVGTTHYRLGLENSHYLGGCSFLLGTLWERIRQRLGDDSESASAILLALTKAFLLDISFVVEAYSHADHQLLEKMAKHDYLTGLPNVNLLRHRLENEIQTAAEGNKVAVVLLGLSRFRTINESMGHAIGDRMLQEVALRLQLAAGNGFLSRMGGDRFAVVHSNCPDSQAVKAVADETLRCLEASFQLDGVSLSIDGNVGFSCYPDHGDDAATLLQNVEIALDEAKRLQKGTQEFEPRLRQHSSEQVSLLGELREAIERDELVLFFQPKLDLSDGKVHSAEALVRWIHPQRGFMPPGLFIPLAEQTTLIHPVTDWVLNAAARQVKAWADAGTDLAVSVNLAAANLQDQGLPGLVQAALNRFDLRPENLILEITESGLMANPEVALATVAQLKKLGTTLSLDDFGTGYSSMGYLKSLPIDEIKIDRTFIKDLVPNSKDEQIVMAVVGLAHALGVKVVAEGVEEDEVSQHLKQLGCDVVQGFYLSKPLPADQFIAWWTEHGQGHSQGSDA